MDEVANALVAPLEALFQGVGYNLYRDSNRARADDLLVRNRVADNLNGAVEALARLGVDYHKRMPTPSREHPFPPADAMAALKAARACKDRVEALASRVLTSSAPGRDATWAAFRTESNLLHQLLQMDLQLVQTSQQILEQARSFSAATWNQDSANQCEGVLSKLEGALRQRDAFLSAM